MSQCQRENPLCIKNGADSNSKFCAVCGVSAEVAMSARPEVPMGASSGSASVAAAAKTQVQSFQQLKASLITTLTANKQRRYDTSSNTIIQTVGGLLVGIGLIFYILDIFGEDGDRNTAGAVVVSLLGMAAFTLVSIKMSKLVTAATAATVPVITYFGIILFASMIEEGNIFLPLLVVGLLYATAWFLPGFCGRQSMLAGAVLFTSSAIVSLTVQSYLTDLARFDSITGDWQGVVERLFLLATIMGVVLIAVAWRLHLFGWEAIATVFIAIGVLQGTIGIVGYISAAEFSNFGGSLLLLLFSIFLLTVGITSNRKATTWYAVAFTVLTLFATVLAMVGESADPVSISVLLVIAGCLIAYFVSAKFDFILNKIPFVRNAPNKTTPIP